MSGPLNHAAAFEPLFRLPDVAGGICQRRGGAGLDADDALLFCGGRRRRRRRRLRKDLNRVDLRILDVAGEGDLELSVGHFHRHRLHVGAVRRPGLLPHVKVLELVALDVEGEDPLALTGDPLVGLGEVQPGDVLAVGHGAGEGIHRVMFRPIEPGVLRIRDRNVRRGRSRCRPQTLPPPSRRCRRNR